MPVSDPARPPSWTGVSRSHPVSYWAALGAILLCFEFYVLGSWVLGSHFVPTPTGPDTVSRGSLLSYRGIEVAVTVATLICMVFWVVLPWRREHLKVGDFSRQWIKFLAIFGFCHGLFALFYMVPNQWLGTHTDAFPQRYPSYMLNGMCVSGEQHDQCPGPGPGVAIPRP